MTSSARDLRYGRRGGAWAEPWTDEQEAAYRQALVEAAAGQAADVVECRQAQEPPSLFDAST